MIKQIIAIILFSVLITIGMPYAQQGLQYIISAHDWISDLLTQVFSGGQAGNIIRNTITLLAIPVLIALVPALIYWIVKRSWFPYFVEIIWVILLIESSALAILYKASTA
jgi:ribose/xylose/arabinose/galactoside ABC-type transport system permease subunit